MVACWEVTASAIPLSLPGLSVTAQTETVYILLRGNGPSTYGGCSHTRFSLRPQICLVTEESPSPGMLGHTGKPLWYTGQQRRNRNRTARLLVSGVALLKTSTRHGDDACL